MTKISICEVIKELDSKLYNELPTIRIAIFVPFSCERSLELLEAIFRGYSYTVLIYLLQNPE